MLSQEAFDTVGLREIDRSELAKKRVMITQKARVTS